MRIGKDRRRYPRVGVALDVTVETSGSRWEAKTLDLSPYGVKVALPANGINLPPGTTVQVRLALPDEGAPLALTAGVVRTDRRGIALCFENMDGGYFARVKALVDSLLAHVSDGSARLEVSVRPVKERRKMPRADAELDVAFDAQKPYDWRGKTINISPIGVKVACPASAIRPSEGTSVKLRLSVPPGSPSLSLKGMVWRREPKAMALIFVDLGREQLEGLRNLVESLQAAPA